MWKKKTDGEKYEKKSWAALITRATGNLPDSKRNNEVILSFSFKAKTCELFRISNDCRKTKTKLITLANHKIQ